MVGDLSDDYSSIKITGNLLVNNKQSKYSCHIGVPFEYQQIGTPKANLEVVDVLVAGPLTFIEISIDLKV